MRLGFSYNAHTQFFKATPRNAVNSSSKMEFRNKPSALKRKEKEQGLACGDGIHPGWRLMWTWNRPRLSAFDCSGSFAWANKSSHELFICASIGRDLALAASLFSPLSSLGWFLLISKCVSWSFSYSCKNNVGFKTRWPLENLLSQWQEFLSHFGWREIKSLDFFHHQHPCCGNTAVNFYCGSAGLSSSLCISCLASTFLAFKVHYW